MVVRRRAFGGRSRIWSLIGCSGVPEANVCWRRQEFVRDQRGSLMCGSAKQAEHHSGSVIGRSVLPDSNDLPPRSFEGARHPTVALLVSGELGRPVLSVGRRCGPVVRTAVPEAPIDEYGDTAAGEHDIHPHAAAVPLDEVVLPKSLASGVQPPPELHLRLRVDFAVPTHHGGHSCAGRHRIGEPACHRRRPTAARPFPSPGCAVSCPTRCMYSSGTTPGVSGGHGADVAGNSRGGRPLAG